MKTIYVLLILLGLFLIHYNTKRTLSYEVLNRDAVLTPTVVQRIPYRIIQTHESNRLPLEFYHSCNQNKFMNPEYEYRFYTRDQREAYIKTHFPEYMADYSALIPGAYKADLFRYLILYREGGVYIDCKTSCVVHLSNFIDPEDDMALVKDLHVMRNYMFNGVIASVPGHPLMKKLIDRYVSNIRSRSYGKNHFDIGGPMAFGRVFNEFVGQSEDATIEMKRYGAISVKCTTGDLVDRETLSYNEYIWTSDKKPLFLRTDRNYAVNKVKNFLLGKDYSVQWFLGRVYR
jgi:mannosyltransferase OCH1-like enzyme